ncbi:MAG: TetR/AcrR family transcriptional regulator [Treponema sp.]|nr:TetR/AcrR family transcriptional regulator [Treponema sp.]
MAVAVEHDKRREKILEKALAVFMDDGFENATFQKIADRCGITRTILYLYFKNKKEIFNFSLKQLLKNAEQNINSIRADKSLNSVDKITKVLYAVFKLLEQNRRLLFVVLEYLLHLSKSEKDPEVRVRRRTVKIRHIISEILIEGIKSGEIKKCNIKEANDYLYGFVEAAIFQLTVLKRKNLNELKETTAFAIKQLCC